MGVITTEELKPGMVLARDLRGANDRFLLPKGTTLENKHLRILKIWGVTEADVKGVERDQTMAEALAAMDPTALRHGEELADILFTRANCGHEAMQEMHRLFLLRAARSLLNHGTLSETPESPDLDLEAPGLFEDVPTPRHLVEEHLKLASFPAIYQRLMEVLNHPRSTSNHVAEVISKDTGLSAKLLKLVNSPFYGFPSAIETIPRAVTLIGANELATMALGVSAIEHFKDIPGDIVDMRCFWEHSIACGLFASTLASRLPGLSEERFFVAGLLHDIGRLVLFKRFPRQMAALMVEARHQGRALEELEKEYLGFDHARLAGFLLKEWKLPHGLVRMIRFHHRPEDAPNILESSLVHLADVMALAMGYGTSGTRLVPPLNPGAWSALGQPPSMLSQTVKQVDRLVDDVMSTFLRAE